jgi:DNA (cytosine-5)-methyltransferase 3A
VEQPQDKGILLKDILESGQPYQAKSHSLTASYDGAVFWNSLQRKQRTMVAEPVGAAMRTREDDNGKFKRLEVNGQEKSNALTSVQTDSMICEPVTKRSLANIRLPDEKANCLLSSSYKGAQANGMTNIPVRIGELEGRGKGQANRIYSVRGKSVCLGANGGGGGAKTGLYKIDLPDGDYIVRKLTPRECARLQTYPERCFDVVNISNTQWYKAFGNGWTVDVIAHIFKQIPTEN